MKDCRDFEKQLENEVRELKAIRGRLQKEFEMMAGPELPNMLKGRDETEGVLRHADPNCRCAALSLLTDHWKAGEAIAPVVQGMALGDTDTQVRCVAISCLASICRGTDDVDIGKILAQLARDEAQEVDVRNAAYRALYGLRGVPVHERPPIGSFQFPRDADWHFVDSFLKQNTSGAT